MKLCKNCGHWRFAGERGSYGSCTEGLADGDEPRGCHSGESTCQDWIPRCRECGNPAYTELYIRSGDEPPISAYYCDRCADELGVWP